MGACVYEFNNILPHTWPPEAGGQAVPCPFGAAVSCHRGGVAGSEYGKAEAGRDHASAQLPKPCSLALFIKIKCVVVLLEGASVERGAVSFAGGG